jgi:hypothetical protein
MRYHLTLVNPLLRVDKFAINGYLHLAVLSPATPRFRRARQFHHCCCVIIIIGLTNVFLHTGLPVKLYIDSQIKSVGLNPMFGSVLNDSITRLMEYIQQLLPPSPKSELGDEVTVKLTW